VSVKQEIVEDESFSFPAIDSPAEAELPIFDPISISRHPDTPVVDNLNDLPEDGGCTKNEDPLKVEVFFSPSILFDEGGSGYNGFFASIIYTIFPT